MPSNRTSTWDLHDRALRQLLVRLDTDPAVAGEKYEQLRRGLVKVFDWRGVRTPEACADETIDRVARKLDHGADIDDVIAFAHGVARLVALEQSRRPEVRQVSLDEATTVACAPSGEAGNERRLHCLDRCLDILDADARSLILRYYVDAQRHRIDARAALARELGLTSNALRSRAQRIRSRLEGCITTCVRRDSSIEGS